MIIAKKRRIVAKVACISSGIMGVILVFKFLGSLLWQTFLDSSTELHMKITHEVQISSDKDAFTNSREALAHLLKQESLAISDLRGDLELKNYQNLKKFPDYILSLSHTKGAGAAVLAKKSDIVSLGIDIEWSDRHLKDEAARFYRHPEDSIHYTNKLELWTMKEAAFKALSPLGHPGVLVLSKIIIQDGVFFTKERPDLCGFVRTYKRPVSEKQSLWVAIAYTL